MRVIYHEAAFLEAWKDAETKTTAAPQQHGAAGKDLHRCLFRTFPYSLVYRTLDSETIQVIAVMHQHREPGLLERPARTLITDL